MNRNHDCATCRDAGVIAPRWQDDTDRMVLCPERCAAAIERAEPIRFSFTPTCDACGRAENLGVDEVFCTTCKPRVREAS